MKSRLILAVCLIFFAACAIFFEIFYLKNTSDNFSSQLNNILDLLSKEDYGDAFSLYEIFEQDFFENENILSVFIHDKAVDEIRDMIYESNAYLKKQTEYFEIEDIVRNLENIKMKIRDIYESMIPNIKNLM